MYMTKDFKIKDFEFQHQECFGLIYTENPTNANAKAKWCCVYYSHSISPVSS